MLIKQDKITSSLSTQIMLLFLLFCVIAGMFTYYSQYNSADKFVHEETENRSRNIAREVDMIPGELVHMIADCHIYDRHIPIIEEMLKRPQFPAPKVTLNHDKKDFYSFTKDDLIIEDYQKNEQIKNIPVAI